jgi:hypothetical protein
MRPRTLIIEPLEARIAPAFAAVIDLSSLDGHNGFSMTAAAGSGPAGYSLSDAGDVNGDGFDDVIIAPIAPTRMDTTPGRATWCLGRRAAFQRIWTSRL